nr:MULTISPECIES: hypothetical protein [Microbulbifer]
MSVALPGDHLHQRPGPVAEDVEIGTEGIRAHLALDDRHQAVDGFPHIDRLPVQVDADIT